MTVTPTRRGGGRRPRLIVAGVIASAALLPACFWTQPGYGPENTRHNPGENQLTVDEVASLAPAWSIVAADSSVSEPLISGGRVIFTARDPNAASVRAVSLTDGATLWDSPIETYDFSLSSSVRFSGDSLWVTHRDDGTTPCPMRLTELDPTDGSTLSSTAVRYPYGGPVSGSGVAVTVESDACLDLAGGPATMTVRDPYTGVPAWSAPLPAMAGTLISDGLIYSGAGGQISAYAAAGCGQPTCAPLWTRSGQARVVTGGRMFSVTQTQTDLGHGAIAVTSRLTVTDAASGAELWTTGYTGGDPYAGFGRGQIVGLAVAGETVYVSAWRDPATPGPAINTLDAFAVAGCGASYCSPTWSGSLNDEARATVVVGGGVVYTGVGNVDGQVVAFDAAGCGSSTCAPLASVPVQGAPDTMSLAQGTLVVTSSAIGGHRVTAFRAS
jgi:hypothetical protein